MYVVHKGRAETCVCAFTLHRFRVKTYPRNLCGAPNISQPQRMMAAVRDLLIKRIKCLLPVVQHSLHSSLLVLVMGSARLHLPAVYEVALSYPQTVSYSQPYCFDSSVGNFLTFCFGGDHTVILKPISCKWL